MEIIEYNQLDKTNYASQVAKLIDLYSDDFIPSLKVRSSMLDRNFTRSIPIYPSTELYYRSIETHPAVLTIDNKKVLGFLSYIASTEEVYVSTLIVDREYRKHGIAKYLYKYLIRTFPDLNISARTWSTNKAHIHLLESIGFTLTKTLENDRTSGVDTVYYTLIR